LAFLLTIGNPIHENQNLDSWDALEECYDYLEEDYPPEIAQYYISEIEKLEDMLDALLATQRDNVIKYLQYFFQV